VHAVDALPPQHIGSFKANPGFRLIEKELLNNNYTLYPNVAKAPWNDFDVRRAFQLSIDVDAAVRVIYLGTAPRAWAPLSPSLFASGEASLRGSWKADPAEAARLLDRAGWKPGARGIREKDGKRLTVSFADTQGNREKRLDVVQFVRRQIQRSGFDLTIDTQPNATYRDKLSNNDFDLGGGSQFAPDPDVLRRLHLSEGRAKSSVSKVDDPEINAWLKAATREPDGEARTDLYLRVQRKLIEQAYAIPIYVLLYNIATLREVEGITIDTHGFPEFHGAWIAA
jgi:peptide/nickel transport system substrate-binding protein